MKKKLLFLVMMVVMLMCVFAISVSAADEVYVTSESELLSALSENASVKLSNDITLTQFQNNNEAWIIAGGKSASLDLNGYTLTAPQNCYISSINRTLVVTDTSQEKTGKIVAVGIYTEFGTLTIDGGTIEQAYTDDYTRSNSVILGYGDITINDVSIIAKSTVFYLNNNNSTMTVNGGKFTSQSNQLIRAEMGTINIKGGSFVHNGTSLVTINNGLVNISGGHFSGDFDTVYSGSRLAITGGTFTFNVSEYIGDAYEQDESGAVVPLKITTPDRLIAALNAGGIVKMESDIVLTSVVSGNESFIINNYVTATLDLNGYTLTAPSNAFVSTRGSFTFIDSSENKTGKIVGMGIYSVQNSTLIIDGIAIEQVITNGSVKEVLLCYGNTTVKDVKITAQCGVIGIYAGATVEVYDGSFETTHSSEYIKKSNGTLKVYGGVYAGVNASSVEAYVQDGYAYVKSTGEVLKNISLDECFVCLGYSAPEDGRGGIAIGYTVNNEAIIQYEKITGKTLKYGVFAVAKDKLGTNDVFAEDGTVADGVINAEISNHGFVAFELKIIGFTDEYKDLKLAMGAYVAVTDGETTEYSYMQSGEPNENEKYCFVSYNDIVGNPSAEEEVVQ